MLPTRSMSRGFGRSSRSEATPHVTQLSRDRFRPSATAIALEQFQPRGGAGGAPHQALGSVREDDTLVEEFRGEKMDAKAVP